MFTQSSRYTRILLNKRRSRDRQKANIFHFSIKYGRIKSFKYEDLISRLFKAYRDFTNKELSLEGIKKNPQHPSILSVLQSMQTELKEANDFDPKKDLNKDGEALSFGTLKKLLFTPKAFFDKNRTLNLQPTIHARIEKYIQLASFVQQKLYYKIEFKGSYLIDEEFKRRILEDRRPFNDIHFYTAVRNEGIQWKGIAKSLDIERRALVTQLKSCVYQCLKIRIPEFVPYS